MAGSVRVDVLSTRQLRFDDGAPVRAASGIAPFEDGWLVVSDDAVHAALWNADGVGRVRVLPAVEGHELFDEASGTKHLKPDLEAACRITTAGPPAALLLGSGSLPARMRAVVVEEGTRRRRQAGIPLLYRRIADVLGISPDVLNLEGACVLGDALRWFQRGNGRLGVPSASIDMELGTLAAVIRGEAPAEAVSIASPRTYDLGGAGGATLAVTDALALPDGRVLLAAAAEDTPNAIEDGPVLDAALVLLDGDRIVARTSLVPGGLDKVEGLALAGIEGSTARIVAVADADDPHTPSQALELAVTLP